MIKSILDRLPEVEKLRKTGVVRGDDTGFASLNRLYSIKQGTFTVVFSEPGHGKSEFSFENCFNQAVKFGKRSLICSPETGTEDEIIAELMHKYTGKQIFESSDYGMNDKEFYDAMAWLNEYFIIMPTDDVSFSVVELFDFCELWEKENPGKRIHIIVGEPYNELKHDMSTFGARQDLYVEDMMTMMRRACRKTKRHFILTIHPNGEPKPVYNPKQKITYYPKPLPRQASSGQGLYRKAMTWITLWRPPAELLDENGIPYGDNVVLVYIDKAKPKGVSHRGMCRLWFDWKKNRYYEKSFGAHLYAFDHEKMPEPEPTPEPVSQDTIQPVEATVLQQELFSVSAMAEVDIIIDPFSGEDPPF